MKAGVQQFDTEKLPWGLRSVVTVWLIWFVLAHLSRVLLDFYTALSPLRFIGAASLQNVRATLFAPGALVAAALLIPILIAAGLAFRTVTSRYQGAPLQALAFTRLNPVWVLAVVVLLGVLLAFLLRAALGRTGYPLPLLEPTAGFLSRLDLLLYAVSVPLTALLVGLFVFGFCYPILVDRLGIWAGGLLCAAFFALPQLAAQGVYWQPAVALLAMGIFLTAVRVRTESTYTATLGYTGFSVYIALSAALAELAISS
ncbi:MAG: hypothetical protein OXE05_01410 [Chloroflexi bacterium]|nr:hypothetical protein [Chloroflexota bacterium]